MCVCVCHLSGSLLVDQGDAVRSVGLSLRLFWCLAVRRVPFPRQNRDQSGPVVVPGQEIQNGIDAAVDADQRPGDLVNKVDRVEGLAGGVQHTGGVVEGARDVKGDEAHGEHHQDHDDQLQSSFVGGGTLLTGRYSEPGAAQRPHHQAITHDDDQEGNAKQEDHNHRAVIDVILE